MYFTALEVYFQRSQQSEGIISVRTEKNHVEENFCGDLGQVIILRVSILCCVHFVLCVSV